jgi:hypothetical protein
VLRKPGRQPKLAYQMGKSIQPLIQTVIDHRDIVGRKETQCDNMINSLFHHNNSKQKTENKHLVNT